jgi:hypothetical protein
LGGLHPLIASCLVEIAGTYPNFTTGALLALGDFIGRVEAPEYGRLILRAERGVFELVGLFLLSHGGFLEVAWLLLREY